MEAGHVILACILEPLPPKAALPVASDVSVIIRNVDSGACKAFLVDQEGKPVAECSSRIQSMHYPGHHNFTLLSCLHKLSLDGHIQLKASSFQPVPHTAYDDDIQQQKSQFHYRWQGRETLAALEACKKQGVILVKVLVRLMPTFFCSPQLAAAAAAGVTSADEGTHAHGQHVTQLLRHLSSPLPNCKYLTVVEDPDGNDEAGTDSHGPSSVAAPVRQQPQEGAFEAAEGDKWVPSDRATTGGHLVHDEVFEIVRPRGWSTELPNPPGLKCQLYRYQRRALAWMVWREQLGLQSDISSTGPAAKPAAAIATQAAGSSCKDSPSGKSSKVGAETALGKRSSAPGTKAARPGKRRKMGKDSEAVVSEAVAAEPAPAVEEEAAAAHAYAQLVRGVQAPASWPDDGRQRLLWAPCKLQAGQVVWLNKEYYSGLVSLTLPPPDLPPLRGGLLCDEMGLGKTVEVIALILARPRSLFQPEGEQADVAPEGPSLKQEQPPAPQGGEERGLRSRAPQWTVKALQSKRGQSYMEVIDMEVEEEPETTDTNHVLRHVNLNGATLIITPPTILQQWVGELKTHSNLKVGTFEGLRQAFSSAHDALSRQARMAEQEAKRCEKRAAKCEQDLLHLHLAHPQLAELPGNVEGASKAGGKQGGGKQGGKKRKAAAAAAAAENGNQEDGLAQAVKEQEKLRKAQASAQAAALEAAQTAASAHRELAALRRDQIAVDEAARLAGCDVVLTTYATLSAEVNWVEQNLERRLRHNKRYPIPDSPLLQVSWHRLVLDEAQMVGTGLTSVAVMANRLSAQHRWCVTGTPMGAGGLQDIFGEICALQYGPLDDPGVFKRLVVEHYLSGSQDGYRRLQLLLKPIMWRNSKAIAAADLSLPPRTLRHALLAMSTPERTFYEHIVSEARKANEAWKAHQDEDPQAPPPHQHGRHHKLQHEGDMLARKAAQQLTQLRLACVHPQLTEYWKQLSTQLGLGQAEGGALSVNEMLSHMCDQAQLELQNEEREYCQAADCLAEKLVRQAERLEPKAANTDEANAAGEASAKGTKRKKQSKSNKQQAAAGEPSQRAAQRNTTQAEDGGNVEDDEEAAGGAWAAASPGMQATKLREECLVLLESSWRVGEKGIDAADSEAAQVFEQLDNISAANASWRAWRLVQIRTCHMLAELYELMGRQDDAVKLHGEVSDKEGELKERVETAIAKAETQLTSLQQRADAIQQQQLTEAWQAAAAEGFPLATFLPERLQPQDWLTTTLSKWQAARDTEAAQRQQEANAQEVLTVLLGTEVSHLLSTEEANVQAVLRQVDALLGSQVCYQAYERVKAALQVLDHHARQQAQQQEAVAGGHSHAAAEGSTSGLADPSTVASALWAASRGVDKAVAWQCAVRLDSKAQALQHVSTLLQGWLLAGSGDAVGLTMLRRALNLASHKLRERALIFEGQLDGEGRTVRLLQECSHSSLGKASEALKMQVELLRIWREVHVESLKVEVETSNRDLIREEVVAAMQGENIRGLTTKYSRMPVGQLRVKCEALRKQCEDLRARKAYLQNQMLEAAGGAAGQAQAGPRQPSVTQTQQQEEQLLQGLRREQETQPQQQQAEGAQLQRQRAGHLSADATAVAGPSSHPHGMNGAVEVPDGDVIGTAMDDKLDGALPGHHVVSPPGLTPHFRQSSPAAAPQMMELGAASQLSSGVCRQTGISGVLHGWPRQFSKHPGRTAPFPADAAGKRAQVQQVSLMGQAVRQDELPDDVQMGDASQAARHSDAAGNDGIAAGPSHAGPSQIHAQHPKKVKETAAMRSTAPFLPAATVVREEDSPPAAKARREQAAGKPALGASPVGALECIDLLDSPSDTPSAPLATGGTDIIDLTLDDVIPAPPQASRAASRPIKIRIKTPSRPENQQPAQLKLEPQQNGPQEAAAVQAGMDVEPESLMNGLGAVDNHNQGDGEAAAKAAQECPICFNALAPGDPLMVYPCGHYFCKECSDTLLAEHKPRCPACRREVSRNQVFRVVAGGGNAGLRHNPEINPPEGRRVAAIKVVGVWMTKLEALLRRILLLRSTAPDEKALVFSHFPSALELVSKALTVNDVGHVSVGMKSYKKATSRDAVARFNTDPLVHVFLLSLHHGAAGLTLVRANHVFMLDISTDPAIEQQAVARVHRIGQQRNVTITRLLCDGTVEMQIKQALQHKQQLFMERAGHHMHVEGEDDAADHTHMYDHDQGHMDIDGPSTSQPGTSLQHAAARPQGTGQLQQPREQAGVLPYNTTANGAGMQPGGNRNELPEEDPESALLVQGALMGSKDEMQLDEAAKLLSQL